MRRLLIRPGAIGDVICSLPAIDCLRTSETEVWTRSDMVPLIDGARSISGLDMLELGLAPQSLWDKLRSFDSIGSWYGSNRDEFKQAVAGLPFTFFPALPDGSKHAVDFYLDHARSLGATGCSDRPRIIVEPIDEGYAVIHPYSGSPKKNWPLDNYREVAEWLEKRMPVYWCAGPEEPLEGATRFDRLDDLARWLAGARLYIGNDSGITHLAAAVGAPVMAIFQSTDPRTWAPKGANVLERPSVDDVLSALSAYLDTSLHQPDPAGFAASRPDSKPPRRSSRQRRP